jgi:hypothetical protein
MYYNHDLDWREEDIITTSIEEQNIFFKPSSSSIWLTKEETEKHLRVVHRLSERECDAVMACFYYRMNKQQKDINKPITSTITWYGE